MKKIIFIFAVVGLLGSSSAWAGNFGLGIVLGDPTGISGKYMLSKGRAIDGAVAWDLAGESDFHLQSTYLFHHFGAFHIDNVPIDVYYGPGLRFINRDRRFEDDESSLAIRAPVGLRYFFQEPSIEVFAEVALALSVVPATEVDLDLGVGARYYF